MTDTGDYVRLPPARELVRSTRVGGLPTSAPAQPGPTSGHPSRKFGKFGSLTEWMTRWADGKQHKKLEYIEAATDLAGATWEEAAGARHRRDRSRL